MMDQGKYIHRPVTNVDALGRYDLLRAFITVILVFVGFNEDYCFVS